MESDLLKKYSPFIQEARKKIVFVVSIFILSTITGFVFYERIIRFLIEALSLKGINIVFTSPFQFINLAIACGVATGLIIVFPLFISQILSFLRPALREREYKMVVRFIPFSIMLFLIGFGFGAIIMRWQIQIFLASSVSLGIGNVLDISRLLTTVLLVSTFLGIGFQFPIALLILMRLNVIDPIQLSRKRYWIYLASFIFAILLPLDSIIADLVLALPLIVLFEITMILNKTLEKKSI